MTKITQVLFEILLLAVAFIAAPIVKKLGLKMWNSGRGIVTR